MPSKWNCCVFSLEQQRLLGAGDDLPGGIE
jgi:hypothetical protein